MSAGVELRLARERRGWSLAELSARIRISQQVLQAIEECRFERLPPAAYLRGFLRSYASEVGLSGGATVERYMAQCQSAEQALTAFDSESTVLEPVVLEPRVLEPAVLEPAVLEPTVLGTIAALRPSEPLAVDEFESELPLAAPPVATASRASTSRAIGRVVALSASVLLVAASVFVVRSLGSAAQPVTLSAMPSAVAAAPAPEPVAPRPAAIDEPIMTPALPEPAISTPDRARAAAAPAASEDLIPILSGLWDLTNEVQSTSYRAFEGLQLGYRLTLAQDGAIVTGRGEKWSENGREIPASRRTPISVAGTLHQGRLELSFTERGTRRSSAGRFVWQVSDDGALRGTFFSDAASSRGSSLARRMP